MYIVVHLVDFNVFAGYIGSVSFLNTVLEVITKLRSVNPGLLYGISLSFTTIIDS